jgi:hypothetical protein
MTGYTFQFGWTSMNLKVRREEQGEKKKYCRCLTTNHRPTRVTLVDRIQHTLLDATMDDYVWPPKDATHTS